MSDSPAIQSLVIAGAGLVGWTAAATLASALRAQKISIRVVNDPVNEPGPAVEAGRFGMRRMHDIIGLDERHLMAATGATFTLGVECGHQQGDTFIHPLGAHGISSGPGRFEHGFIKRRLADSTEAFSDYFLAAQAARAGKFAFHNSDPRSILSTLNPGMHIDAERYGLYLKNFALHLGVEYVSASIAQPTLGPDGFIESLTLNDGSCLQADFYIDCTGAHSRLLGGALETPFESWDQWFAPKRIASVKQSISSAPAPLTHVAAQPWGWHRAVPVQDGIGHEWIYQPEQVSVEQLLRGLGDGQALSAAQVTDGGIHAGRRKVFWQNNCLALGMAGGCLDPIALSNLHWAHTALILFLDCWPDRDCRFPVRQEFNRLCGETFERLRDFQLVHAILLKNGDSGAAMPDSLARRLELFRHRGRLLPYENDVVPAPSWEALLLSAGIVPEQYEPVVDTVPEQELMVQHRNIKQAIQRALEKMPSHADVLARYCPPLRA